MSEQEPGKSVAWMVTMVMILVAVFGWAFMAANYATHVEGWREGELDDGPGRLKAKAMAALISGMIQFVINAFRQIPDVFRVIGYNFRHAAWLPIGLLVVEGGIFASSFWLKKLEAELGTHPDQIRRKKKKRKKKRRPPPDAV